MSIGRNFEQIVITSPLRLDPALAIAASRAGELGVLNLEFSDDIGAAREALVFLTNHINSECGIKIAGRNHTLLDQLFQQPLPSAVRTIVITAYDEPDLDVYFPVFQRERLRVLLEITDIKQARLGEQLGVDGLIAKGNEAAGWVGEETTFILLQKLLSNCSLRVYAYGGIGLHTAAACYAAGAAGIVLDSQLALARESMLPDNIKQAISRMDGSETVCLGSNLERRFRIYHKPQAEAIDQLQQVERDLSSRADGDRLLDWQRAIEQAIGPDDLQENIWPIGQAAAFAADLAAKYHTVGGVLRAMRETAVEHSRIAARLKPLDAHSPLAASHNTTYPVVQGPMTRVSDRAEFAHEVAEAGGLPFLALSLMRSPDVEELLEQTSDLLGDLPWGVGILGFAPRELKEEQLEVIKKYAPPFALIAGGRPDQTRQLEKLGIHTYLHVPSPGLLQLFLKDGARYFVFEGRECGGHVGPRSSFVLWNMMVDILLAELPTSEASDCHVLFAGGIHDRYSAAMVATLAAPLAQHGVRIGVLMGTAYLFTKEAVSTGSITSGFQSAALECHETVLLESGPGHATRCAVSPIVNQFQQEKRRLQEEGHDVEEVRIALENFNVGRLRIASKGITRDQAYGKDSDAPKYTVVSVKDQRDSGLYMIGQLATLRAETVSIADLHREVTVGGTAVLAEQENSWGETVQAEAQPSKVAIVGMSTLLPKAPDWHTYWANILNKVDAIEEIPPERWSADLYFDSNRDASDKIYSRHGGFLDDVAFDPLEFGIPPNSLKSIDPLHLLALVAARDALKDAGYDSRPFDRSRTSVILGASGGTGDLGANYLLRSGLPLLFGEEGFDIAQQAGDSLPEWTEDSFAGLLLNVAAGRIANRFDFGGMNYVVDAACASSLAAIYLAVKELESKSTDTVIVGGVDTVQNPFGYLCFSKTQALSPSGEPRVFDAEGDGIVISEGVAMLVLKRLEDAERDGDRIYAVISAVTGSSDGRAMGMTAPRPEGQALALQRAYEKAGIDPTTVDLFEAHGTGTVVGDQTEAQTLAAFLQQHGAGSAMHGLGSVKSMIGHTKATAGVAGMVKVAAALHYKVLPPTLRVTTPNPKANFGEGPLYINSETRPWLQKTNSEPRRAGVSAFGFGGTNFHAVLEEYRGDFLDRRDLALHEWPSELFLWQGNSSAELLGSLDTLSSALAPAGEIQMRDLAYTVWQNAASAPGPYRLAIVATTIADLKEKLDSTRTRLQSDGDEPIDDPAGIYYATRPAYETAKIAFLFSGQGSQYVGMLNDLAVQFPTVRAAFERFDQILDGHFEKPLSHYIFPPPSFTAEDHKASQAALTATNVAQPALGAVEMALYLLLNELNVVPDMVAGHSYGEYPALCAAGVFDMAALARLSEARGRFIVEEAEADLGTMAAVWADKPAVEKQLDGMEEVWVANLNSPQQTIISGTQMGVQRAVDQLKESDITARAIPVACGFHSPLMMPAKRRLAALLAETPFLPPRIPVFANVSGAAYPDDEPEMRALLEEQLIEPVLFSRELDELYAAGARIFVEIGPKSVLTGLARNNLDGRPCRAMAVDDPGRHGLTQLQTTLAQLAVQGVRINLETFFSGRDVQLLDLRYPDNVSKASVTPTTWLINGSRAKPADSPPDSIFQPPLESASMVQTTHHQLNGNQAASDTLPGSTAVHADGNQVEHRDGSNSQSPVLSSPPTVAGDEVVGDEASQVMMQFQQTMSRFLETQERVMLAYLQRNSNTVTIPGAHNNTPRPQRSPGKAAKAPSAPVKPYSAPRESKPAPQPAETPLAAPAVPTAEQPKVSAFPDESTLTEALLRIVGDRTGYPPQMLKLEVDIEADLGIDSIKRVEILGVLQHDCFPEDFQLSSDEMEELTSLKTLRSIVDWLTQIALDRIEPDTGPAERESEEVVVENSRSAAWEGENRGKVIEVPRSILTAVSAPALVDRYPQFAEDRVVLVTDDGRGIAKAVVDKINSSGGLAFLIENVEKNISRIVSDIREDNRRIAGVIHLQPLRDRTLSWPEMTLPTWKEQQRDTRDLFVLLQNTGTDLRVATDSHQAWIIGTTKLGYHLYDAAPLSESISPSQAGVAGMIKSLAQEWPDALCKVIHFGDEADVHGVADQLLHEMAMDDGLVEVLHVQGGRYFRQPVLSPLPVNDAPQLALDSESIIVLTGGARGITAEVAVTLAREFRPTLILLGRSPAPASTDPDHVAELESAQDIKQAMIARRQAEGKPVALKEIEAEYRRLLNAREIRRTLVRIHAAGANVQYVQADVREAEQIERLFEQIYEQYGKIDGVIHGAGIIEDRRLEDKSVESFDRVFDTKVDSALILSKAVRWPDLKFFVFFSSAAAAFGNAGQTDYAAANEVLNKLARLLDERGSTRVAALNWGPWLTTGMVNDALQDMFSRREISLIEIPAGCNATLQEILFGRQGESEVLLAGGAWGAGVPEQSSPAMFSSTSIEEVTGDTVSLNRDLSVDEDLFLLDHVLDEKPVLPFAVALELMCEAAALGWPDLRVASIKNMQLFKGIVVNEPRSIRLTAERQDEDSAIMRISDPASGEMFYQADVELAVDQPDSRLYRPPDLTLETFPLPVSQAYEEYLFHGPLFQGITDIEGIAPNRLTAKIRPSRPSQLLASSVNGTSDWMIDPVVFDSALQMIILWTRHYRNETPLPSRFDKYTRFGPLGEQPVTCHLIVPNGAIRGLFTVDIAFADENGKLLGLLEGMECPSSEALNRLAARQTAAST